MSWNKEILQDIMVKPKEKLASVLPLMEKAAMQVLLVVNEDKHLLGIITDGDIRRSLLRGDSLQIPISMVMNSSPVSFLVGTPLAEIKKQMLKKNIRHAPLVDDAGRLVDLILWLDIFNRKVNKKPEQVIIMAGGKGTRLAPFTKILPKPMIPLGEKPIIEVIMDKFYNQGFYNFTLSVGYKAEIIKMYFNENNGRPYNISYIQEEKPLGTAGALNLLNGKVENTCVVTNCDIIMETDFDEVLNFHKDKLNDITVIASLKEFTIPYGVIKNEEEILKDIEEKPNFHFLVNTGVYIIEPQIFELIQNDHFTHMTDLVNTAKINGYKVGVYPFHGKWFDIGQWEEYRLTVKAFEKVNK